MRTMATVPGNLDAFMDGNGHSSIAAQKREKWCTPVQTLKITSRVVTRVIDELRFMIGTIVGNQ